MNAITLIGKIYDPILDSGQRLLEVENVFVDGEAMVPCQSFGSLDEALGEFEDKKVKITIEQVGE